jgi:riboflavin synthase
VGSGLFIECSKGECPFNNDAYCSLTAENFVIIAQMNDDHIVVKTTFAEDEAHHNITELLWKTLSLLYSKKAKEAEL